MKGFLSILLALVMLASALILASCEVLPENKTTPTPDGQFTIEGDPAEYSREYREAKYRLPPK